MLNRLKIPQLHLLSLTICLLIVPAFVTAQQVHTYTDRDSVQVGDIITYSIVLEGDYTLREYPDRAAFEDDFEMLSRQRFQVSARKDSLVFRLQYFGAEDLEIPAQPIVLNTAGRDTTVYSNRVPLFFKTTLTGEDDEFRPLKPIFDFARAWWPYIIGILLLFITGWLLYRYYQKQKFKKESAPPPLFKPEPFINPVEQLEIQLNELKELIHRDDPDQNELFYIQIGDAIRLYLKQVYSFMALEMTTGEIINHLHSENVSYDLIQSTKKVLNEADLVKFANFNPDSELKRKALNTGFNFLETAKTIDMERINYLRYKHEENQKAKLEKHREAVQKHEESIS